VLRSESRELLARRCRCVWLDAPAAVLAARLAADPLRRPALTALEPLAELERLADERRVHYAELAELVLDSSLAQPSSLASEVLARLCG
jgi:shikimate kinase